MINGFSYVVGISVFFHYSKVMGIGWSGAKDFSIESQSELSLPFFAGKNVIDIVLKHGVSGSSWKHWKCGNVVDIMLKNGAKESKREWLEGVRRGFWKQSCENHLKIYLCHIVGARQRQPSPMRQDTMGWNCVKSAHSIHTHESHSHGLGSAWANRQADGWAQ